MPITSGARSPRWPRHSCGLLEEGGEMNPKETQAILTVSLLAAFADGDKHERERAEIKRIAEGLSQDDGVHLPTLYQDVLMKRVTLASAAGRPGQRPRRASSPTRWRCASATPTARSPRPSGASWTSCAPRSGSTRAGRGEFSRSRPRSWPRRRWRAGARRPRPLRHAAARAPPSTTPNSTAPSSTPPSSTARSSCCPRRCRRWRSSRCR